MKIKEDLLGPCYWDSVAEKTGKYHLEKNIAIYKKDEHIKIIKNWGGDFKDKKILKTDLYEDAFGDDSFLFWLLSYNSEIFGMDVSQRVASKTKSRFKKLNSDFKNYITADVRNCAFKHESFDLIISNSTLDNLASCDVPGALLELKRILKPKGILILTLDNGNNPLYRLGYLIEKFLKTNKYYQACCYSVKEAEYLAKQSNFTIEDITAIVHIPTPFNKIALLLTKSNSRNFVKFVRNSIALFSKLGYGKTKFLTGWFIALKLVKNGD